MPCIIAFLLFFWWFNNWQLQLYGRKCTCNKFCFSSWCFESMYCNPLKLKVFFAISQKSCSVLNQRGHLERLVNCCSVLELTVVFFFKIWRCVCPTCKMASQTMKWCICALLIFTLQVEGLFSGNYKKALKKLLLKT